MIENGVKKDDHVAVTGKNSPEWAIVYFAALFAGAVIIPIDAGLRVEETEILLKTARPVLLFCDEEKYPYFAKGVIPAKMYDGVDHDTQTIGVKAVLVTDASQSDEAVRAVVKAILDNFDEYKKLHPALNLVSKESLLEGLSAPLHPAAEAVYKEAGLLK